MTAASPIGEWVGAEMIDFPGRGTQVSDASFSWRRRGRRATIALMLVGLAVVLAGCAFDSGLTVQFRRGSQVVVTESSGEQESSHRVRGETTRDGQVVRVDCSVTIFYTVREATGTAFLTQRYLVHLHTRQLPSGTAYEVDCNDPLIVELPADASAVRATSTSRSGRRVALPVKAQVHSIPLALGKRLRAERRTQFAVVRWPRTLSAGDYRVELAFDLPQARAIRLKALYAVSVSCGGSSYLQPILPLVTGMAAVPAFTIQPSAQATGILLPRVAGAAGAQAEATQTLACVH
jgi:hypothetical protein